EVLSQTALNAEAVLIEVRAADVRINGAEAEHADGRPADASNDGPLPAEIRNQRHVLREADRPGEFARLRVVSGLGGQQVGWRIDSLIGRDVVENLVVPDAEAAANHRLVFAEELFAEAGRPGEAQDRSDVVLVGIDAAGRELDRRLAENQRVTPLLCRIDV